MVKRKPRRSPKLKTADRPRRRPSRRVRIIDGVEHLKPRSEVQTKPLRIREFIDRRLLPDPYARRLELPKLPAGLRVGSGMNSEMAMDEGGSPAFPYQGYFGNAFNLYFPGYPYLAMLAQRSEYRQPVETHAKDMTREWIEFKSTSKSDKSKRIKEIEERFTELGIQDLFRKALVHDGFFGVGHIAVDLKGNQDTKLPILLDPKSIKKGSLKGFRNIEPMWVTPIMWNGYDPLRDDFYAPTSWVALDRTMDASRLIQVLSRALPDILKPAYNFGGISLSQLIEPYVDRWLKTVGGVNRLINNFSLIYLKTNMSAVLQGDEGDENLLKRLKMARLQGDNTGAFALDMNAEDLGQVAVPLAGLAELQQQSLEHMAYPTHEPLVVLTGITPSGLNASSDGEIEVYHDWNRSEQQAVIYKPLKYVFDIVQLDMYGKIDPEISFGFKPIKQVTGEALARIKKTQAEQDVAYIDAGVVDAQEVREKVARDPDSGFTNLDTAKVIEAPENDLDGAGELDDEGEHVEAAAA